MLNMPELDEMARAILGKMLSVNFPGAAELREQAENVTVLAREDGWNDIALEVSSTAPKGPVVYERPVQLSWPGLRSRTGLDADLTLVQLPFIDSFDQSPDCEQKLRFALLSVGRQEGEERQKSGLCSEVASKIKARKIHRKLLRYLNKRPPGVVPI